MQQITEIYNKTVLLRVGFDIPSFDTLDRIHSAKESVLKLVEQGNTVVLLTKWGRPKGDFVDLLSTSRIVSMCSEIFNIPVLYINQYKTKQISDCKKDIEESGKHIILLENLYFDSRENSKDVNERNQIAEQYSQLGDIFIDDCFISSHRKDATNTEICTLLPSYKGCHYTKEVEHLEPLKQNPENPFVLIMGGAKLKTKLPVISALIDSVDTILLGGKLANTFLYALSHGSTEIEGYTQVDVFDSEVEIDFLDKARLLLKSYPHKIVLPIDLSYFTDNNGKIYAFDIGPQSIKLYSEILSKSKTVFWNGPLGFTEKEGYEKGTQSIAQTIVSCKDCYSVAGGGDTVASLDEIVKEQFSYISQGGGASLYYLSKK